MRFVAILAVLAAGPVLAQSAASRPVVRLAEGAVRGESADGVDRWLGIPFAAAPTGANRWRPPQPAQAWRGIRDATRYGHDCMQLPFPSDAAPLGTAPSEDCLVLNVWRPRGTSAAAKLPVIVWIYGGGFVNGGSSPPTYSGANLAKQGVVVVSFNYRLGRFGTFVHPALDRAARDEQSGNFGFIDQLAALSWVRANVGAFGGDPGAVTIVGESAGGMSVNTLVTSPLAAGLFHRAVVMSGGDGENGATRETAQAAGVAFAAAQGIAADSPDAAARLRALPAARIVDGLNLATMAPRPGQPRTFTSPYVDGRLALPIAQEYRAGRFARVPIMIGATSADIGGPDGFMIAGARRLAAAIAGAGVPVYRYRFSYVAESLPVGAGAAHASDIPFFFDTQRVKYGASTTARDDAIGRTISRYLVNFARAGDPNGAGLPTWKRTDRTARSLMDLAASGTATPVEETEPR